MKLAFSAPRTMLENKPPHGASCTRCGLCCVASLCDLAFELFKNKTEPAAFGLGPCPALIREADGGYGCGVVKNPRQYSDIPASAVDDDELRNAALALTRAGQGCDARFNGEPVNAEFNAKLDALDLTMQAEIAAAKNLWGLS